MYPRSRQWHLIDYVMVRQRDAQDVRITRALRGAECWTDHRLIHATLNLHIAHHFPKRPKAVCTAFNAAKLQELSHICKFQSTLVKKLFTNGPLTGDSTQKWNQFKELVTEAAKTVLGPKIRLHQDWFNENDSAIEDLLARKNKAFVEW